MISRPSNLRAAIVGALTLLAAACGGPPHPVGDVHFRWIEDHPQTMLDPASYLEPVPRFDLAVKSSKDRERWHLNDLEPANARGEVFRFDRTGTDPWIATEIEVSTDDVTVIEIDVVNISRVGLQLFWAGPGETFSDKRRELARPIAREGKWKTFRFELGSNPAWRGGIDRLRIDFSPEENRRMGLIALRGLGRTVDQDRLAEVMGRPWQITLGSDARGSLPGLPGLHHDRRLKIPENATLVFGYGLQPAVRSPIRFMVQAVDDSGKGETLFDRTLSTGGSRRGSWHDARVDLGAFAGRELTLSLSTGEISDFDATRGLPVWSNPEIIAPKGPDDRPNILVIVLDTLRSDHLGGYGYDLPTSPAIDSWGTTSATRFTTAVAAAPWTLPSHVSIFTGLDAMRHGFNYWGSVPTSLELIAETLRGEGYTTAAITGGAVLLPQFGYAQGFDTFEYWAHTDTSTEIDWAFGRATEWLDINRDRRFFLFLHTYEIHFPHRRRDPYFSDFADHRKTDPPGGEIDLRERPWKNLRFPGLYFLIKRPGDQSWEEPLTDAEIELVGLMYDSAIRHTDDFVRDLFNHLDDIGLDDNTIVILTSDHGEELGDDRGRAGHAYVSEANVLVPLYIAQPNGAGAGEVIDQQVRLIDLQPTILDLAGIDPPNEVDGRSLVPMMEGRDTDFPGDAWTYAASSNLGLAVRRDSHIKYLFPNPAWVEAAGGEELYELVPDPGEDKNLAVDDERIPALRGLARETILEQHRGFRLEIRNNGRSILAGELTGSWSAHDRVKTADHDCGCISRAKGQQPAFTMAPGVGTTLLFEGLEGFDVGLRGHLEHPDGAKTAPFEIKFDLTAITTPAVIVREGSNWIMLEDHDATIDTGFVITRHGPEDAATGRRDAEAETLDQLRALGYVQ